MGTIPTAGICGVPGPFVNGGRLPHSMGLLTATAVATCPGLALAEVAPAVASYVGAGQRATLLETALIAATPVLAGSFLKLLGLRLGRRPETPPASPSTALATASHFTSAIPGWTEGELIGFFMPLLLLLEGIAPEWHEIQDMRREGGSHFEDLETLTYVGSVALPIRRAAQSIRDLLKAMKERNWNQSDKSLFLLCTRVVEGVLTKTYPPGPNPFAWHLGADESWDGRGRIIAKHLRSLALCYGLLLKAFDLVSLRPWTMAEKTHVLLQAAGAECDLYGKQDRIKALLDVLKDSRSEGTEPQEILRRTKVSPRPQSWVPPPSSSPADRNPLKKTALEESDLHRRVRSLVRAMQKRQWTDEEISDFLSALFETYRSRIDLYINHGISSS